MGRYFIYHMHPFSLREINSTSLNENLINAPIKTSKDKFDQLIKFGGFPEPFLRGEQRFYNRWIVTLSSLHYCFKLRPYSKNIPRTQ